MTVLLLGIDYRPLHLVSVRRAVGLVLAGRADVIEVAENRVLRSARAELPVPLVIRLTHVIRMPFRRVPLTRRTLSARDQGECQVAGCGKSGRTIDHVVPRSRGGTHEWTNVVLMCEHHNQRKGDRLLAELRWQLKSVPVEPRYAVVLLAGAGTSAASAWEPWLAAA